ncbi:MAG: hypothetical protein IT462_07595 [Planctomycetes bacterium]|nr:hypothetical protein [Planctomycetota bacterium]
MRKNAKKKRCFVTVYSIGKDGKETFETRESRVHSEVVKPAAKAAKRSYRKAS